LTGLWSLLSRRRNRSWYREELDHSHTDARDDRFRIPWLQSQIPIGLWWERWEIHFNFVGILCHRFVVPLWQIRVDLWRVNRRGTIVVDYDSTAKGNRIKFNLVPTLRVGT